MLEAGVERVRGALEGALGSAVVDLAPVGGGCISPAARVTLADGRVLFVKTAPADAAADLFREEARSLTRLREAGSLRVPAVVAVDDAFIVLEWLEPARGGSPGIQAELGRGLARLHRHTAKSWGWDSDNYIGPLPQANGRLDSWPAFWRERRLGPQLARAGGLLDAPTLDGFDRLIERLDELLDSAAADGPSLLHGDLWSGNVHAAEDGPALIDPASYYGHREVDLAMAALFGGFSADFEAAYGAEWPLLPGAEVRRAVYQLYYLLVHVNLFGGSYVARTQAVLRQALG